MVAVSTSRIRPATGRWLTRIAGALGRWRGTCSGVNGRATQPLRLRGRVGLWPRGGTTSQRDHWNRPSNRALTPERGIAGAASVPMKRLGFLFFLGSCAGMADTPPSPALRDVKISYVHADPDWIRQRG